MASRRKKKRASIDRHEGVQQIDQMIGIIEENVRISLEIEAALQSANHIVVSSLSRTGAQGAGCYNTVKNALALYLALTLAQLFEDKPQRPNRSDVGSIPLLLRLMKQKRHRAALVARARQWTPHLPEMADDHAASCDDAINRAIGAYSRLRNAREGRQTLGALAQFRNKKLTHSLRGIAPKALPRHWQLLLLVDLARDVTNDAKLAIRGDYDDLNDVSRQLYRQSEAFWTPTIKAAATQRERL